MKRIALACLSLLPALVLAKSLTPLPECSPLYPLNSDQVAIYSVNDDSAFFTKANMPDGYSWGATLRLLNLGKEVRTFLHCEDASQFFKVQKDSKSCIIDSETLLSGNNVHVYREDGLQCHVELISHNSSDHTETYHYLVVTK